MEACVLLKLPERTRAKVTYQLAHPPPRLTVRRRAPRAVSNREAADVPAASFETPRFARLLRMR
jgi:hypothetical protein